MAYEDRLRTAQYTSPSGATFELSFDEVERSGGKKAAVHDLPQQDIATVQDLGNQAVKYPLSVYFTGENYDQRADSFWTALSERGPGILAHPRFGDIQVLPVSWGQTENWVDGVGRADFKIEFIPAPDTDSPLTVYAASQSIDAQTSAAMSDSASEAILSPDNAADLAAIGALVRGWLDAYESAFGAIAAAVSSVQTAIAKAINTITGTLDTLLAAPTALFGALVDLVNLPARITTNVADKVAAYKNQIESLIASIPETYSQAAVAIESLLYSFGGAAISTTVGTMATRAQAVQAAEDLTVMTETVLAYTEETEAATGYQVSQSFLAVILDAISNARQSVLAQSFSLKSERRFVLDTPRTPLDLIAELYGDNVADIDSVLNEFIEINHLMGDSILLIPRGREVVYYA